ncbi:ferritin-like domain-containing protein [Alkalihalobacillus sp. MEB130]|uniref:ferritin-like domain-containing protein n=1 Tax=Alkalihalobacillus sp. MEB130 TaxID=2976704 RepID=UPI0028DEF619|nr:ferritin-like domain-containing protein [Alkalihalobacillus sp. MEB130]MDT8860280.1 ferritin-like domain-containing protein [Alkalihalobacillus sp. MEB130]
MYSPTYYYRQNEGQDLISNIMRAINGQYSAIACYEQLARLAPTQEIRKKILEIRQDEVRHFHVFSEIYVSLTGRQPSPQITEACPTDYRSGLNAAFMDEQETVDFYLDIADKTSDRYIQQQFRRAAADEQNHAVWFLYFLTQR